MYDKNKLLIDMKLGGGGGKAYMKLKRDEQGEFGVGGSTN